MYNMVAMKDFAGNSATIKYLEQAVTSGELSHAYLFCGPQSVGKTRAGSYFAKMLLCESSSPSSCDGCPSCKLFDSGNHPDFFHIDNDSVLVDDIRELVGSLELKPYRGKNKVALISHAEKLTNQALNAFLKTLEEPNEHTIIILTTENKKNLLPTIVSRTRTINFGLMTEKGVFELLNGDLGVIKENALKISKLSAGRIGIAIELATDTDRITEITNLVEEFNKTYRSQDIYEKISYADRFSKDKDNLMNKLQNIELANRGELLAHDLSLQGKNKANSIVNMLDKIAKTKEMIAGNANAKLVIEGLLLGSIG